MNKPKKKFYCMANGNREEGCWLDEGKPENCWIDNQPKKKEDCECWELQDRKETPPSRPKKEDTRALMGDDFLLSSGSNLAYEEWESFLPGDIEIYSIILNLKKGNLNLTEWEIAKAIAKRIGK